MPFAENLSINFLRLCTGFLIFINKQAARALKNAGCNNKERAGGSVMNFRVIVLAAIGVLSATGASAQAGISGQYRCIENCRGPGPTFVTQSGWDLNLVNETGLPSRAWIDWPGHIWADDWKLGAIVSPDGLTIQFDNGTVWQRDFGTPTARKKVK